VCLKEIKPELNTLDEADFVRDVDKSSYHNLSQSATQNRGRCAQSLEAYCLSLNWRGIERASRTSKVPSLEQRIPCDAQPGDKD
jgi:hypothetical protein